MPFDAAATRAAAMSLISLAWLAAPTTICGAQTVLTASVSARIERLDAPFVLLEPTEADRRVWASARHVQQAFDGAHDGITAVTLIVERRDCDDSLGSLYPKQALSLVLVIERGANATHWALRPPPSVVCEEREAGWALSDRHTGTRDPDADLEAGGLSDRTPVLHVRDVATWDRVETGRELVVDARSTPPILAAALTSTLNDQFCGYRSMPPTHISCEWDDGRGDFACAETYDEKAVRRSWLFSRLPRQGGPDDPASVTTAAWLDTVVAGATRPGAATHTTDLGHVRLIAEIPGRQRDVRIFLLGADDVTGRPFYVATRRRLVTELVPVTTVRPLETSDDFGADSPALDDYVSIGEPPTFSARTLRIAGSVTLLQIVESATHHTRLWHVGIDTSAESVVAQALSLVTSTPAFLPMLLDPANYADACTSTGFGGYFRPRRVTGHPLSIDYEVEPTFDYRSSDDGPQHSSDWCTTGARAVWRRDAGFDIASTGAVCSPTRFRVAFVRPDGSLDVRSLTPAPR